VAATPIKRLPEVAQASVPSHPSTVPIQRDTASIAQAQRGPSSGTLSSWFSRFQRQPVDQASAVTGANTISDRISSRTVNSDIVFQDPPSTASAGVMRLPPTGAPPMSDAAQPIPGITMLPAPAGTSRRTADSITEEFTRDLVADNPRSLVLAAPESAKPTVDPTAPALRVESPVATRPTSRRLPPPPETIGKSSRADTVGSSPTLIPPTLSPVDRQPKLEPPKAYPAAPRLAGQSIGDGRSRLSAINPFSDSSAPRTIQDLHAEIIAQQPPAAPAAPQPTGPYARPKIIFRPIAMNAHAQHGHGHALLKPEATVVSQGAEGPVVPPQTTVPDGVVTESLPAPEGFPTEMEYPMEAEWAPMGNEKDTYGVGGWKECWYRVLANLNGPRSCPPGIGVENVMNAPFWLETTQPINNCVVRADAAADWEYPDRLEYFWSKTPGPKGPQVGFPLGEPEIDYQDVQFYIERGGDRFSVGTLLPIRAVDPEDRFNTTGFADMTVTPKIVLLDGKDWQISHVFKTHIPTGSFRRGTGNGHVSLEPGVAWRYKWSDVTYFHGDLTYWFPIAGDLEWAGQFLNYGIGISHVLYDSDCYAIMPTFEVNVWTLLDGRETLPRSLAFNEIDTYSVINLHPGLRIVCDTSGDCGVREFGISSGVAVTQEHWYEEILRLELRWVF
jgi:hypothetical protein